MGKIAISKHHYARALERMGATVYFLNPPKNSHKDIELKKITDHEQLFEVNYGLYFPYRIKFHFRGLFDLLMRFQIKKIIRKIGKRIDVVWCFDPNLFSDLRAFGGELNIYHPVDYIHSTDQIMVGKTADIVFSVSSSILSKFKALDKPMVLINHGLGQEFGQLANAEITSTTNSPLKVGYVGNLTRSLINRRLILDLVKNHPDMQFHFYGPFDADSNNIGADMDDDTISFISILKKETHVHLHGVMGPDELSKAIGAMDVFLLLYNAQQNVYDCSNSHKILEYLSTGKVILSNKIDYYENYPELLETTTNDSDDELKELFDEVTGNIAIYNSVEKQQLRKRFAQSNTYEEQIRRIQESISDNLQL